MSFKRKYLTVFDFDGVIYKGHSIFDFIKYQEENNMVPKGTWAKAKNTLHLYKKNIINYDRAANDMLAIYARSLTGNSYKEVKEESKKYLKRNSDNIFDHIKRLLKELKDTYDIYIISTNYQFTIEAACEIFDLDGYISSIAEIRNGLFTGKVERSLAGNKDIIEDLFSKYPKEKSIAVGDSENDIKMLESVEFPVCFEPNEKLEKHAKKTGWLITNRKSIADEIGKMLSV